MEKSELLAEKTRLLNEIKRLCLEFNSLGGKEKPAHFSALMLLAMVENPEGGPTADGEQVDIIRSIITGGKVDAILNMLENIFEAQPPVFAIIQEAVVNYIYKHFDPESAAKLLNAPSKENG